MAADAPTDASHVRDAESRFTTLVKFDIVGSTPIWSRLSRPDALELRRAFRSAVHAVLPSYAVRIEWEGDGALLAFGYPEPRVDAAETAVRTGLRLIDAVRNVAVVPGTRLELRVGIASGAVTIDLRSDALEGLAINKAERLKTTAGPGQVIVADDTRHLVGKFFEYEDLGDIPLKGFDGPTHAWRVVGETAIGSRFAARGWEASRRAIVGRAHTLSHLSEAWRNALAGRGTAVCLVGDAGMGKSRLARAVLDQAERDGARVLEIDCTPSAGNTPLLPVGALLRRTAGIGANATEDDKEHAAAALLTRLLGEQPAREAFTYLAPLFGIQSAPIPLDKTREEVRAATLAALVEMVRALARQSPLAILCEDLHWADDTTAQVVHAVARIVGELRTLLIVTRWPKAVTPIDLDAVTTACASIPVEPLPAADAATLVRAVAGDSLPAEDVSAIVNRCGGVPLLLEEVAESSLESTDSSTPAGREHAAGSAVPPELQLVVESRLGRWPDARAVVETACVLGREFPVPLLQAMLPERRDVAETLALFADHGLFELSLPGTTDRARFRHALIRDAVYETLVSRDYLRWLHSRAADALIAGYLGTADASPDVLAQHLKMADRLDEAIRIRLDAGEDSFKRGAYVEAQGQCEAARALLGEIRHAEPLRPEAFRLAVLRGMVGAAVDGYSAMPVELAYREAQAMFDVRTGADLRYPVIRGLATAYLVRGDLATAHAYSLDGLALAEESRRPDFRIDAMSVLAYTTLYFGRLEECRTWIDRCLSLYDAEGGHTFRYPVPQDAKTAALALLPTAAWLLGDWRGAERAIELGLNHVDRLGREFDKALLHAWIAGTRYTQRRYLEALQHAGIAYALGKEHRFQEWEGTGAMMALLSQSALQPAPEAVANAMAAGQQFQAKGVGLNASYFLWGIARGLLVAGNRDDARTMLTAALAAAAASQETRMNPEIWMLQAELEPDQAHASRLLLDAFTLAEQQGAVANALRAGTTLVARESHGATEHARAILDVLEGRISPAADQPEWMRETLASVRTLVQAARPSIDA